MATEQHCYHADGRQQRVLIGESTRVTCIIYTPAEFNYGSLTS